MKISDELRDAAATAVSWASTVSDQWTGTLYEGMIDAAKKRLYDSLLEGEEKIIRDDISDLVQLLEHAESEYDRNE